MNRISELDYMRGIAIILVVMGHVVLFSLKIDNADIIMLFSIFHIPIFFTVSGFLAHKNSERVCFYNEMKRLLKRSMALLVPFVVWSLVNNVLKNSISGSLSIIYWGGYWFFLALWWCDVLYIVINLISRKWNLSLIADIILYAVIYAIILLGRLEGFDLGGWLPIINVQYYFPFFTIGILMRKHAVIYKYSLNKYTYAFGLVFVIIGWYFSYLHSYALFAVAAFGAVSVTWMACKEMNPNSKVAGLLSIVGKKTLAVYAIHYLFIARSPQLLQDMASVPMFFFSSL